MTLEEHKAQVEAITAAVECDADLFASEVLGFLFWLEVFARLRVAEAGWGAAVTTTNKRARAALKRKRRG